MIYRKITWSKLIILAASVALLSLLSSCGKQATPPKSWEQARNEAMRTMNTREEWPASPEAVCRAFWEARRAENYTEMAILWPGSGSYDWPEICKKDNPAAKYVFGEANEAKTDVPYASEEYFKEYGSYNLTMKMGSIESPKGLRYSSFPGTEITGNGTGAMSPNMWEIPNKADAGDA